MHKIIFFISLLCFGVVHAQELNCTVQVNSDKIGQTNKQVFKTLEKSLNEFLNKTKWTNQTYRQKERIECSMFITINSYGSDQFSGTLQVQSSRPIYGSSYSTPVLNFNDKDVVFKYIEYENLIFSPNSFDSNLVALMAFYSYMIIGMDADTFGKMGGTDYYEQAQSVASLAQQGGYKGWSQIDGNQNRFFLVNDMLSGTFDPIRDAFYSYHLEGLDRMSDNPKEAKSKIMETLMSLNQIYSIRPNAFLTRVFFDAKADEIQSVFSGGPQTNAAELANMLNKLSPINSSKWSAIKI